MSGLYTMLSLGGFNFGLSTSVYQELKRSTEYIWASQNRFGAAPAVQFIGFGDETISLPGVIFPAWNGGLKQIDGFREMAALKKPLTMIDGRGNLMGDWVIERIDESQTNFAQMGAPRKQEFTLSLKKYADVIPATGILAPIAGLGDKLPIPAGVSALPAISKTISPLSDALDMVKSATATANSALASAKRISGQIGSAIGSVAKVASSLGIHSTLVTNALNKSLSITNQIRTGASNGLDLLGRVQTTTSAISSVQKMYNSVTGPDRTAANSTASIKSSLTALTALGAPKDALAAVTDALTSANKVTSLASSLRDNTNTFLKQVGVKGG